MRNIRGERVKGTRATKFGAGGYVVQRQVNLAVRGMFVLLRN